MKRYMAALGVVLVVTACYKYVPETSPEPVLGADYRAHLTPTGTQTLTKTLGADVVAFEGRILSATDTGYVVSMAQTISRQYARPVSWTGDQMAIPRSTIARFERREFDRKRSVRYAALYTAGAFLAGSAWISIRGKATSNGTPGPGPINP